MSDLLFANADMNATASAHVLPVIEMIRTANVVLKVNYLDVK